MNETIRDYLKRRVWWCMGVGFAGWLVFASALFTERHSINPVVNAMGAMVFGGAIVFAQYWIKCPRCSVRLGQIAFTLGIPGLRPKPRFCPYCGVSFDEPRTPQTATGQPINPIR